MKVLTVKQPWAWLIFNAGKEIENRTWRTSYRGPLAIHTSAKQTEEEHTAAIAFCYKRGLGDAFWDMPIDLDDGTFILGHIIGVVDLVDCVQESDSPWFVGSWGWKLANPRLLSQPIPARGQLSLWQHNVADPADMFGGAA